MSYWGFRPYVPVAQRRATAQNHLAKLAKKGQKISPVKLEGKTIARTFWGKAWCNNLESYSDYANRLPRGRTYVRNGSVVDLQILPGKVVAMVAGSEIYDIEIKIGRLPLKTWTIIKEKCAGQISSLVELLQGRFSNAIMGIISARDEGMFPSPAEIDMDCSCPDWADMCKHIAAVLYGVGSRLDEKPELLFVLRQVDHLELIAHAGSAKKLVKSAGSAKTKTIAADQVAEVFGIELDEKPNTQTSSAATAASSPATATPAKLSRLAIKRRQCKTKAKKTKKIVKSGETKSAEKSSNPQPPTTT